MVKNLPAMQGTCVQSLGWEDPWRKWQPTPIFLPGEFHGYRSLAGYSPRGQKEMDMTDYHSYISKRVQLENIHDSISPTINYYSQLSVCVCVCARGKSCLTLCSLVYCIVTCQFPLFMEFSRQEYWSGLPFHTLGDLPDSGMEPTSPVWQVDPLPLCHLGKWWKWKSLSRVRLFAAPWTIESMEFSRPEYWSGQLFPSPGDLPNPGIEPRSLTLQADSLPAEPSEKPKNSGVGTLSLLQRIFPTQESNPGLLHCGQILYQPSHLGSFSQLITLQ